MNYFIMLTACPRSLDPFYIVPYHIKGVKTYWTYVSYYYYYHYYILLFIYILFSKSLPTDFVSNFGVSPASGDSFQVHN